MSQLSREEIDSIINGGNGSTSGGKVEFFSLKNDGDEAVVRFMHDDVSSFDVVVSHQTEKNGRFAGRVSCLRRQDEPIENCPFCAAGIESERKAYIHIIQYVKNADGTIVGVPKVWERSVSFLRQLNSYLIDYGPLSKCLFKVRRSGAAGDRKTTYSINYCPPTAYPDAIYPVDYNAFEDYSADGRAVMRRTFDDMLAYIQTGSFPAKATETATDSVMDIEAAFNTTPVQPVPQAPVMPQHTVAPATQGVFPTGGMARPQGTVQRPIRTY